MDEKRIGTLICCSSGGTTNVKTVKRLIDYLSLMKYDFLEICMEDLFQIPEEPYFGYLRGGYSKEEMHEIVSYGEEKGIEVIPSIQLLAHLKHLLKLPMYWDVKDIDDILLIGEEKTYELIDHILKTVREYFKTDKVNIGFDEAHKVGLGKYLDKHGYQNRFNLLCGHLQKVCEIAEKYGFKPHMWSDMFFRLVNKGDYYGKNLHIPKAVINKIPSNVGIIYWDYYSRDAEMYDSMFKSHLETKKETWFATCAWCHNGFAPQNRLSLYTSEIAFKSLEKYNVNNIIVTLWGDDGNECSFFSVLPSLFAMKQFSLGNYDEDKIAKEFEELFGVNYYSFLKLDLPNKTKSNQDLIKITNPCKSMLYNDCFLGWKDFDIEKEGHIDFEAYSKELSEIGKEMKEFKYLFDNLSILCKALSFKGELGVKTRKAYKANNKNELRKLLKQYQQAYIWVKKFHESFKERWFEDNKPFYWEIHEARLGGLESRILQCKNRIQMYLKNKISRIEELEVEILPYSDWGLQYNDYLGSISTSS